MYKNRLEIILEIAKVIIAAKSSRPLLIAVTGITASGKTTLSNELHNLLLDQGYESYRSSIDYFHNSKKVRYGSAKESWLAYYEDAHDYESMIERLLKPLTQGNEKYFQDGSLDLVKDIEIHPVKQYVSNDAFIIVDGSFLLKPILNSYWGFRIVIDTDFNIARERGVIRDSNLLSSQENAEKQYIERYHKASRHYLNTVNPAKQADIIVYNNNIKHQKLEFNS